MFFLECSSSAKKEKTCRGKLPLFILLSELSCYFIYRELRSRSGHWRIYTGCVRCYIRCCSSTVVQNEGAVFLGISYRKDPEPSPTAQCVALLNVISNNPSILRCGSPPKKEKKKHLNWMQTFSKAILTERENRLGIHSPCRSPSPIFLLIGS